ncbi:hypothetical protein Sste5346_009635 [Sporothrix stenoceras]|uniref:Phosphoinositide phospholipase C n=1 Tax=Sporothrix stenoceras TaxID=5173 RepID=A0ABR3YJ13_9PEZI
MLVVPLEKDRYKFEEFLEVWCYQYNWNASRPPPVSEVLDMSFPISQYFISSSHNTYLVGNQLSSEASVGEYQKVLENNCRCIEIDVWNPPTKTSRQTNNRKTASKPSNHRRHLSSSSVATSIHESFEAISNLLATKISRSRASSFSNMSIHAPTHVENANADVEPPCPQTLEEAALSKLKEQNSTLVGGEAIDDGESNDTREASSTGGGSETPQTSQDPSEPTIATISVTAPDTEISIPAEVPDSLDLSGEDEPVVMHAHNILYNDWTLGTHVPFRDVCRAVRHTAFRTNTLPVIVSLEVHTNALQQRKMVKIMKEEWGDLLLDQPLDSTDPRLRLPTLGELQNKILVKVKKPYTPRWSSGGTNNTVGSQGIGLGASLTVMSTMDNGNGGTSGSEDDVTGNNITAAATKNARITEELGSLAVYTESRHYHSFADRDAKLPSHIFSLSETAIQALHLKSHEDLFLHNKKYLMRAYPNATKHVTSSNPDPACCWRRGVQMVALNWQTLDKAMMLNHGMFEGSNGWVLKPQGYRGSATATATATAANSVIADSVVGTPISPVARPGKTPISSPNPNASSSSKLCPVGTAEPTQTIDLYITVYAGQHLPLPPAFQKKQKKKAGGAVIKTASTAGVVTGRGHAHFRPIVKCELNVEHHEERCPEAVGTASHTLSHTSSQSQFQPKPVARRTSSIATAVSASQAATTATASPSTASALKLASSPVQLPEAVLKQKTTAGETDHPDWGVQGETLRFRNVTGIVESLSFVSFCVEDEGSKNTQERAKLAALGRNGTLAGWACIRLDRLRTGYRFVSLMDAKGNPTEGKLLVRIEKLVR